MIVGGLTEFNGVIVLVNPTQPDQGDPAALVVGAGPSFYKFIHDRHKRHWCKGQERQRDQSQRRSQCGRLFILFHIHDQPCDRFCPALLSITNTPDGVAVSCWPALRAGRCKPATRLPTTGAKLFGERLRIPLSLTPTSGKFILPTPTVNGSGVLQLPGPTVAGTCFQTNCAGDGEINHHSGHIHERGYERRG